MNKVFLTTSVAMALVSAAIGESWAMTCTFTSVGNGRYALSVSGSANDTTFSSTSCDSGPLPDNATSLNSIRSNIESISFGDNVTAIADNACYNYINLKSVDMPNVTTIGNRAFNDSNQIRSLNMPKVTTIGNYAFSADKLTSLDMPEVTTLGYGAFQSIYSLQSISAPKLQTDGGFSNPINGTTLKYIEIPANLSLTIYTSSGYLVSVTNSSNCHSQNGQKICTTCSGTNPIFKPNLAYDSLYSSTGSPGSCVADGGCGTGYTQVNGLCTLPTGCVSVTNGACSCFSGYLTNDSNGCTHTGACKDGVHAENGACVSNPVGCNTYANGTCSQCSSGYLSNGTGTCMSADSCKNGFHVANNACVANSDANCNTEVGGKCAECKGGYLEQDGDCVTSCGEGYRNMGTFCNKVRWTPAEAAAVLRDDDTNVVTITFKLQ